MRSPPARRPNRGPRANTGHRRVQAPPADRGFQLSAATPVADQPGAHVGPTPQRQCPRQRSIPAERRCGSTPARASRARAPQIRHGRPPQTCVHEHSTRRTRSLRPPTTPKPGTACAATRIGSAVPLRRNGVVMLEPPAHFRGWSPQTRHVTRSTDTPADQPAETRINATLEGAESARQPNRVRRYCRLACAAHLASKTPGISTPDTRPNGQTLAQVSEMSQPGRCHREEVPCPRPSRPYQPSRCRRGYCKTPRPCSPCYRRRFACISSGCSPAVTATWARWPTRRVKASRR